MKPVEYYKDREQTYVKHYFLEGYLETVAYHIGFSHPEFVYVDCFSGPWRAKGEDLGDTSIRIALDRLNSVRDGIAARGHYPTIRAIFVEKSPRAFKALQHLLSEHSRAVKTTALPGTFESNIGNILDRVGSAFTFFFIDPTGWTGFPMNDLRPILQRAKGEVMINFMYDDINRFVSSRDPATEHSFDLCFGTTTWRDVRDVISCDREQWLVDLYVKQIRSTGNFPYVTFTPILKPLHDRTYFHLIYATRNPKGIEKFRDVEKRVLGEQDVVREGAQREHREHTTGQTELDYVDDVPSRGFRDDRETQLQKAARQVKALLARGPIRYGVLQPLILQLPLVSNSDLTKILMDGRRSGNWMIDGMGARDRVPKSHCTIRL